jgi:hypothetical protein
MGLAGEKKLRWCKPCSAAHPGAVQRHGNVRGTLA